MLENLAFDMVFIANALVALIQLERRKAFLTVIENLAFDMVFIANALVALIQLERRKAFLTVIENLAFGMVFITNVLDTLIPLEWRQVFYFFNKQQHIKKVYNDSIRYRPIFIMGDYDFDFLRK